MTVKPDKDKYDGIISYYSAVLKVYSLIRKKMSKWEMIFDFFIGADTVESTML